MLSNIRFFKKQRRLLLISSTPRFVVLLGRMIYRTRGKFFDEDEDDDNNMPPVPPPTVSSRVPQAVPQVAGPRLPLVVSFRASSFILSKVVLPTPEKMELHAETL